jgi:hypothetical protein
VISPDLCEFFRGATLEAHLAGLSARWFQGARIELAAVRLALHVNDNGAARGQRDDQANPEERSLQMVRTIV